MLKYQPYPRTPKKVLPAPPCCCWAGAGHCSRPVKADQIDCFWARQRGQAGKLSTATFMLFWVPRHFSVRGKPNTMPMISFTLLKSSLIISVSAISTKRAANINKVHGIKTITVENKTTQRNAGWGYDTLSYCRVTAYWVLLFTHCYCTFWADKNQIPCMTVIPCYAMDFWWHKRRLFSARALRTSYSMKRSMFKHIEVYWYNLMKTSVYKPSKLLQHKQRHAHRWVWAPKASH